MAKLLMITGDRSLASGKQGAFYNTLEEFHQYWDRIDIICPRGSTSGDKLACLFGHVFVHPSPEPLWKQPWWIYKKGLEIYQSQKFNLVIVHEFPPFYNGIGARLLWNKIKIPYVLEVHHIPGYPKIASFKEVVYRKLMRFFIGYDTKKSKAVRVVNQNQVPDFLKRAGVPAEKIKYIPSLYIDLGIFRPMGLKKEYDLIFVGRLVENKGTDLFLEAVKKLEATAVIVGEGALLKEVQLKTKNYKLKTKIWGWAKDSQEVAELINKSKILIMPSGNEGGPRVVAEALACGVPVLATPVGMVPDFAKEGAVEVINWDAGDIVKKAQELLENQQLYEQYRQAGLILIQQFEKTAMIKNYADKLKEIL